MSKIKNWENFLNENIKNEFIAYHISDYNFNKFNSSEHIGNFGTVLDGSYFLDTKKGLENFGTGDFLYKVEINPKQIFKFNLKTNNHWYLSTEFQELFSESLAGISNYLDSFFDEQKITNVNNIDCVILTNLEYLNNKNTKEYIVLNDNIITIINKTEI